MIGRIKQLIAWFQQSALGRFIAKWSEDNGSTLAIVIAYYALVSLIPLLLAITAVIGFVVRDPGTLRAVENLVITAFPGDLASDLLATVNSARENAGSYGIVAILGLLWSGSGLFGGIEQALNNVYRVPPRSVVSSKLIAIVMTLLFIVLILVAVLASSVTTLLLNTTQQALQQVLPFQIPGWAFFQAWVGRAVSFLALFLLFVAIYFIVPNTRESLWEVVPGALLATVLFGLATQLLPIYLHYFGSSYRAYAAFGVLLLLVFWVWILGNILVLSGELNAFLCRPELRQTQASPPPPHPRSVAVAATQGRQEPCKPRERATRQGVPKGALWVATLLLYLWDRISGGRRRSRPSYASSRSG